MKYLRHFENINENKLRTQECLWKYLNTDEVSNYIISHKQVIVSNSDHSRVKKIFSSECLAEITDTKMIIHTGEGIHKNIYYLYFFDDEYFLLVRRYNISGSISGSGYYLLIDGWDGLESFVRNRL